MKIGDVRERIFRRWVAAGSRSFQLGRWLVSLNENTTHHYTTFWMRAPPNRCIGIYEQPIAHNGIDGVVYGLKWSGEPTDEEIIELVMLL